MEGFWADLLLLLAIIIAALAIVNPLQGWAQREDARTDGEDGRPPSEPPR